MGTLINVWLIILLILFVFVLLAIMMLKLEVSFIFYKYKKHPLIMKLLQDTLDRICTEEGITVLYKSSKEINKKTPNEDDWAIGKYIYIHDANMGTHTKVLEEYIESRRKIEEYYSITFEEYCKRNNEKYVPIEEYKYPRILLTDTLRLNDMGSYYSTFFHELGHHFAVKEKGSDHDEKDADRYAHMLIMKELPYFFQLFYDFRDRFIDKELNFFQRIPAYYKYFNYLVKEKIYNFKLKRIENAV
jgi:hypothetical protein